MVPKMVKRSRNSPKLGKRGKGKGGRGAEGTGGEDLHMDPDVTCTDTRTWRRERDLELVKSSINAATSLSVRR